MLLGPMAFHCGLEVNCLRRILNIYAFWIIYCAATVNINLHIHLIFQAFWDKWLRTSVKLPAAVFFFIHSLLFFTSVLHEQTLQREMINHPTSSAASELSNTMPRSEGLHIPCPPGQRWTDTGHWKQCVIPEVKLKPKQSCNYTNKPVTRLQAFQGSADWSTLSRSCLLRRFLMPVSTYLMNSSRPASPAFLMLRQPFTHINMHSGPPNQLVVCTYGW